MNTLLLDVDAWDLCLDARGNIALAGDPYAIVQSVASACRLFLGELLYDTTRGVPYWPDVFQNNYPLPLIKDDLAAAALTVPGVTSATVYLDDVTDRSITGQVQVQTTFGVLLVSI